MTDLTIRQARTWELQVGWYNPLPGSDPPQPDLNSPVVLTGYAAKLQVRRFDGDTSPAALTLTSSPPAGLVVNGPAGTVDIAANPTQTAVLGTGLWYWELVVDNGVKRYTLDEGRLTVDPQVTVYA